MKVKHQILLLGVHNCRRIKLNDWSKIKFDCSILILGSFSFLIDLSNYGSLNRHFKFYYRILFRLLLTQTLTKNCVWFVKIRILCILLLLFGRPLHQSTFYSNSCVSHQTSVQSRIHFVFGFRVIAIWRQ